MVRSLAVLVLCLMLTPSAQAQSSAPLLALWEFGGWAAPTAERPLGLRFVLLEDGRVVFAPDDPAMDRLIPNQYYQAHLSPEEMQQLTATLMRPLQRHATRTMEKADTWTTFYFRDETGALRQVAFPGHPCIARGRVFSATAPVAGLQSTQNSIDRKSLPRSIRQACNLLAGFHHTESEPWSPQAVPAPIPAR